MIDRLQPNETELTGNWVMEGKHVRGDAVCLRIQELTAHHLKRISTAGGGWDTLFRDPDDGRYWEQTYPYSAMHGGGPPRLAAMPAEEAKKKYKL